MKNDGHAHPDDEYEMEIGATQGREHAQVLEQTIGRERALDDVTKLGPPTRQASSPGPSAADEDEG